MKAEPLVVLDIRGLLIHSLHRGKDAEGIVTEANPRPINRAAYGFGNFFDMYLREALSMVAPRRLIAAWDGGNEFRRALFPDYKKHREEPLPEENEERLKLYLYTKDLLKGIGAFQVSVAGVEADDVIAYLVENLPGRKVLFTVDADLLSLQTADDVEDSCLVFLRGEVVRRYKDNVAPELVSVYKSIVGDSSDGYPGVKGMGPAAWKTLLDEYGEDGLGELHEYVKHEDFRELDKTLAELNTGDEVTPGLKLLNQLYIQREAWTAQYRLARFHPELCTGVNGKKFAKLEWVRRVPSRPRVMDVLAQAGIVSTADQGIPDWLELVLPTVTLVTQDNIATELRRLQHMLDDSPFVSFDFESFDTLRNPAFLEASNKSSFVDVLSQKITGCSFTVGSNCQHTFYLSVHHQDTANCKAETIQWVLEEVERHGKELVAQNAQFEVTLCATNFDWVPATAPWDTKILASYVDENQPADLKTMSNLYLVYRQITYEEVIGEAAGMHELSGTKVLQYATDDAICTAALFDLFRFRLQLEGTLDFVSQYENEVLWPLADAFFDGVRINQVRLSEMQVEDKATVTKGIAKVREQLEAHCSEFNLERATSFFTVIWPYEERKLLEVGTDRDKIESKRKDLWNRTYLASQYRPYVVRTEVEEHKLSPSTLGRVAKHLGFREIPKLPSMTVNKVNEWLSVMWTTELDPTTPAAPGLEQRRELVKLLGAAAPMLKKQVGGEYEQLVDFCSKVLTEHNTKIVASGDELNFDSPVQMQHLLYVKLGLPVRVYSKVTDDSLRKKFGMEGAPSTDEKAVKMALAEDCQEGDWRHDLLTTYLEVKKALTREKFYWRPYPLWAHPRDGAVHGAIINCGTVTRRPTGTSPNLLQISKKDDGRVRTMFLPRYDDHVIVSADFAGQELRLMASESQDPALIDAYCSKPEKDIHSLTAATLCPILLPRLPGRAPTTHPSYDEFVAWLKYNGEDEDQLGLAKAAKVIRNVYAKQVNFLIIYGGGPGTLARNIGIPTDLAKQIIDAWFRAYPKVKRWQEQAAELAKRHGYARTAYGNRRHVGDGILSDNDDEVSRWSRQAANYQIQGCAADILKVVLAGASRTNLFADTESVLIAPIYDEITSSVPLVHVLEYVPRLIQLMEVTPPGHPISMVAEVSIGFNWGSLIELGAHPTPEAIRKACERATYEQAP